MCLGVVETFDHHLVDCTFSQETFKGIFKWCDIGFQSFSTVVDRGEHRLSWVGFRVQPKPIRVFRFLGFRTCWVWFLVVFNFWVLGSVVSVLGFNP